MYLQLQSVLHLRNFVVDNSVEIIIYRFRQKGRILAIWASGNVIKVKFISSREKDYNKSEIFVWFDVYLG